MLDSRATEFRDDPLRRRQARLARRARLVRWAKWLLPTGALVLIAAIFVAGREGGGGFEVFTPGELARLGAGLRLENPRLTGVTERNQPYELTAAAALPEDGLVADVIALEAPRGWIETEDRRVTAVADRARLDRDRELLELVGGVRLETSDGWQGETSRLTVALGERRASGPEVRASGPRGWLEAGSFRVEQPAGDDAEPRIWFENGVHLMFTPRRDGEPPVEERTSLAD